MWSKSAWAGALQSHRSNSLSTWQLAAGTCTAAAVAAVVAALSCRTWKLHEERAFEAASEYEELLRFLRELSRRLFQFAREISALARAVRRDLAGRKLVVENEEGFRAELSQEYKVAEKIAEIQKSVLAYCGCTEEFVRKTQMQWCHDEAVRIQIEGTQRMLQDALGGEAPVLPSIDACNALTEDEVVEIHCKMQRLKIQEARFYSQQLGQKRCSPEELGELVAMISQAAETQVLEAHRDVMGKSGELYHSAMALHLRSPKFAARVAEVDAEHRQQMVAVFTDESNEVD